MQTVEVVRVKFLFPGRIFEFLNPHGLPLKRNDRVVVKTDYGHNKVGTVVIPPRLRARRQDDRELTEVVRLASDQDQALSQVSDEFIRDLKNFFQTRLSAHQVTGVRFVDAEKLDGGTRLIVYFQSEERAFDPKLFAIEIGQKFKMRVDLRGVGIRDAARLAGGIGKCGLSLCCSTWLPDFQQVSVRMAKDQGLSPEPDGITGQCGRLLCCLGYEHDNYVAIGKGLPKVGKIVITPQGEGRVAKLDILKGLITVRLKTPDGNDFGEVVTFESKDVERKFAAQSSEGRSSKPNTDPDDSQVEDEE